MDKNIITLILRSLSNGELTVEEAIEILLSIFNFDCK